MAMVPESKDFLHGGRNRKIEHFIEVKGWALHNSYSNEFPSSTVGFKNVSPPLLIFWKKNADSFRQSTRGFLYMFPLQICTSAHNKQPDFLMAALETQGTVKERKNIQTMNRAIIRL